MGAFKFDMSKFDAQMKQAIEDVSAPAYMKQFGEYARDRIVKRTKLGKGVSERGGDAEQLKKLSDSYRTQRKNLQNKGKLADDTSPARSNLTRTGQMLNNIEVQAKTASALISAKGSRTDGNLTNADVAGYVSVERPFLNLSKPELNGLNSFIRSILESIVKKRLT